MSFRFQKRVKILPGVTLNFSKSGVTTSVGGKGAKVTFGGGKTRTTVGIPGTGISHTSIKRTAPSTRRPTSSTPAMPAEPTPTHRSTFALLVDRFIAGFYGIVAFACARAAYLAGTGERPSSIAAGVMAAIAAFFAFRAVARWGKGNTTTTKATPTVATTLGPVASPTASTQYETKFPTSVVGVSHTNRNRTRRQSIIRKHAAPGAPLDMRREPDNEYDDNAIAVYCKGLQIGYLSAELAAEYAPGMDGGHITLTGTITEVTGGTEGKETLGVNATVTVHEVGEAEAPGQ